MKPLDASQTLPLEGGASFSLGNRLFRAVWMCVWFMFAKFTPIPLHGWRRLILRAFGAQVGKGVRIHGSASIWLPANLELGDYVLIGPGALIYNQGHISIGARSVISLG